MGKVGRAGCSVLQAVKASVARQANRIGFEFIQEAEFRITLNYGNMPPLV